MCLYVVILGSNSIFCCLALQNTGLQQSNYVIHPDWVSEGHSKSQTRGSNRAYKPWPFEFHGARHWPWGIPNQNKPMMAPSRPTHQGFYHHPWNGRSRTTMYVADTSRSLTNGGYTSGSRSWNGRPTIQKQMIANEVQWENPHKMPYIDDYTKHRMDPLYAEYYDHLQVPPSTMPFKYQSPRRHVHFAPLPPVRDRTQSQGKPYMNFVNSQWW